MQYDFETLTERRNTGALKYNNMLLRAPEAPKDIVPLSIADMEFKNPPEIIEGLKQYLDNTILGYTKPTNNYYKAVISWMERKHGFSPKKEWFIISSGIFETIKEMILVFTDPHDSVLLLAPSYFPFQFAVEVNERKALMSELILEDGSYRIDFQDFEEKASRPETKLFILCSPHNPTGRVWTKEELEKICEICLRNNVFIISDEVHSDIIMPGYEHISLGTFDKRYLNNCAICTSPSKTFNIAGLRISNIFIPNPMYKWKLVKVKDYLEPNMLAYKACEIAYNECEEWLDQATNYISENRKFVETYIKEKLPEIKVANLEGSYLLWLDFRAWGMTDIELEYFLCHEAFAIFDEGRLFGQGGKGFERMNLACPRYVLEETLERIVGVTN